MNTLALEIESEEVLQVRLTLALERIARIMGEMMIFQKDNANRVVRELDAIEKAISDGHQR